MKDSPESKVIGFRKEYKTRIGGGGRESQFSSIKVRHDPLCFTFLALPLLFSVAYHFFCVRRFKQDHHEVISLPSCPGLCELSAHQGGCPLQQASLQALRRRQWQLQHVYVYLFYRLCSIITNKRRQHSSTSMMSTLIWMNSPALAPIARTPKRAATEAMLASSTQSTVCERSIRTTSGSMLVMSSKARSSTPSTAEKRSPRPSTSSNSTP